MRLSVELSHRLARIVRKRRNKGRPCRPQKYRSRESSRERVFMMQPSKDGCGPNGIGFSATTNLYRSSYPTVSRSCCSVQAALGWAVTLQWINRQLRCSMTTKTYSTRGAVSLLAIVNVLRQGAPRQCEVSSFLSRIAGRARHQSDCRNFSVSRCGPRLGLTDSYTGPLGLAFVNTSASLAWTRKPQRSHIRRPCNGCTREDRSFVQEAFQKSILEQSDFELDCRIVRTDGSFRHVHSLAHPVFGGTYETVAVLRTSD
jgi:hypothetical protein